MQNELIARIREFYFLNGLSSAQGGNACPDAFEHFMLRKADITDMPQRCVFDSMNDSFTLSFTDLQSDDVTKFKNCHQIDSTTIKHDPIKHEHTFILSVRATWNAFEEFKKSFHEKLQTNPREITNYISVPTLISAIMMSSEGLENALDEKKDAGVLDKAMFNSFDAVQKNLATATLVEIESMRSNNGMAREMYKGFEEIRDQWNAFLKAYPEVKDRKECREHVAHLDNQLNLAIAKLTPAVKVQTPKQWRGMRFLERGDVKQAVERASNYPQEVVQRMVK